MGWFSKRGAPAWDLGGVEPPWRGGISIHAHVRSHLGADGRLAKAGTTLPDEKDDGRLRWVAGGLDGAFGHHVGGGGAEPRAEAVLRALQGVLADATASRLEQLYAQILEGSVLGYIDPLLVALRQTDDLDVERLHELATWLAERAPDREAVKLGIAILGGLSGPDHRELLLTLGAHEEFTLYAAVALLHRGGSEAERDVLALARRVDGWGRIQIVERLAHTSDPEIKAWMLREGYENAVMNEYLAYTCATAGGLREALARARVDDALLKGAGDIIVALINGGPAEDMDDYADGAAVVEDYVRHLGTAPQQLAQLLVVDRIRDFLERGEDEDDDESRWEGREARGWTPELRERLGARCDAIVALPHWPAQVSAGLLADDRVGFWVADQAAKVLGIDTWDRHYERLESGDASRWYDVMKTSDPARIDRVIALAEERLDLQAIARGPANEMGFGPEWSQHTSLDYLLQDLGRFPGKGWPLIRAGLRSPVIRNRNMALQALGTWGRERWPAEAQALLEQAAREEVNDGVSERIGRVRAGDEDDEDDEDGDEA